jgi:2-keto-3-deoxy-L-rhamnonate aldolase RhmA
MRGKKLSLGMFYGIRGPELLPTLAQAGLNHIIIDHMFRGIDWPLTADLCSYARNSGLAPILRVQTYPWGGDPNGDMRAISEVARGRSVGAAGAMVSMSSVAQLKGCMRVAADVEHLPGVGNSTRAVERYERGGWDAFKEPVSEAGRTFPIVAYIEDVALLNQLEEIVEVEGLTAIGLGIHDICYSLGHPFDVEHPEVWKIIDRVVALAKRLNLSVWTNTGYRFSMVDETIARIQRLYDHGVDTIQVQTPEQYLFPTIAAIVVGAQDAVSAPSASKQTIP